MSACFRSCVFIRLSSVIHFYSSAFGRVFLFVCLRSSVIVFCFLSCVLIRLPSVVSSYSSAIGRLFLFVCLRSCVLIRLSSVVSSYSSVFGHLFLSVCMLSVICSYSSAFGRLLLVVSFPSSKPSRWLSRKSFRLGRSNKRLKTVNVSVARVISMDATTVGSRRSILDGVLRSIAISQAWIKGSHSGRQMSPKSPKRGSSPCTRD